MKRFVFPLLDHQDATILPVPNLFSRAICRRPSGVGDLERCVQPGARNGRRP
ncbi:hypothetical protein O206_18075 [Ochrobactrum sp. EGD-AQ16]|nr:hypothetical protein O206_18075 [Ochrobactrum sp. EGD-AQ16]